MAKINVDLDEITSLSTLGYFQFRGGVHVNSSGDMQMVKGVSGVSECTALSKIAELIRNLSDNLTWKNLGMQNVSSTLSSYANELNIIEERVNRLHKFFEYMALYAYVDDEIAEKAISVVDVTVSLSEENNERINVLYEKILLGTATAAEIEEYLKLYEQTLTDEERQNMEEFFGTFPNEDAAKIKEILYTAEEPVRSKIMNMLKSGEIKIVKTNGGSEYRPGLNTFFIDFTDMIGENDDRKYQVIWHELGHAIDDMEKTQNDFDSNNGSWTDYYVNEDGKIINDLIIEDARTTINKYIDEAYPNLPEKDKKEIIDYMISGKKTDISVMNILKVSSIRSKMSKDMYNDIDYAASDCYSCITDYGIKPGKKNHDQEYDDYSAQSEAFAHYISSKMEKDPAAEESFKKYMPSVYEEYEKRFGANS